MPSRRAFRKTPAEWEGRKDRICELYGHHNLADTIDKLAEEDFIVSKRQLVYRLDLWGIRKYNHPNEDWHPTTVHNFDDNISIGGGGDESYNEPNSFKKPKKYPAPRVPIISRRGDTDPTPTVRWQTQRSSVDAGGKLQDSDNRRLTSLIINYMQEAIVTGTVFVDPADPLAKGSRLFKWAADFIEAVRTTTRANANPTTTTTWIVSPAMRDQMVILNEVILDEHPQLLSTLFSVWKGTYQVDDGGEISRTFIAKVRYQCQMALGDQHIISRIFGCLCEGNFDPNLCLERLEVLPSELFAEGFHIDELTFERNETSNYGTVTSLSSEGFRDNMKARSSLLPRRGFSQHGAGSTFKDSALPQISTSVLPPRTTQRDLDPQVQEPQTLLSAMRLGHVPTVDVGGPGTEPQKRETSSSVDDESTLTEGESTASESPTNFTVDEERSLIVATVMESFLQRLDIYLEELGYCENEGANFVSDASEIGIRTRGSTAWDSKGYSESRKRTRRADEKSSGRHRNPANRKDNEGNKSEDKENNDQRRRKRPQQADGIDPIRLACPYFKWNPRRYYQQKLCCGPGWTSVHRLKEHLYRRHAKPPFRCRRCQVDQRTESALETHQQMEPPCEVAASQRPCDKFGTEIERRLRIRSSGSKSEPDKWIEMYRTLFDVRDEDLPTPYYDLDTAFLDQEETMREYARREIVPLMREQLEIEVVRAFADIGPSLVRRLREIVRNLEIPLRQNFERDRGRARDASEDEFRIIPPDPVPNDQEEAGNIDASVPRPSNQAGDPGWDLPGPLGYYPVQNQQQNTAYQGNELDVTESDQSWILNMDSRQPEADWDEIFLQPGGNSYLDGEGQ